MRIVIDTDSKTEQSQISKINTTSTEAQHDSSMVASSPMDAGHARVPDGYANDPTNQTMQLAGNTSFAVAGAIDAGAPKVQQEQTIASAMPDTGNMETYNTSFSAGPIANAVHN